MGQAKVSFGLSNVYYAVMDTTAATPTWSVPKPIPGAVTFSPDAQVTDYKFAADNKEAYYEVFRDNGDSGDLTIAYMPDDFLVDVLGWIKDDNGALVELSGQPNKTFALMFEVQAVDNKEKLDPFRVVYYNVTGSKPKRGYKTMDAGVEVQTHVMTISAKPVEFSGIGQLTRVSMTESAGGAAYESFFSAVYKPQISQAP